MARTRTGTLLSKNGKFYLRVMVDGKFLYRNLGTCSRKDAERLKADALVELGVTARNTADVLKHVQERIAGTEATWAQKEAERQAAAAAHAALLVRRQNCPLWADSWQAYVDSERRKKPSAATMKQYQYQWGEFANWMHEHHPDITRPADVTPAIAAEYMRDLGKTMTVSTKNRHRALLIAVYRTFIRDGRAERNPFEGITHERTEQLGRREIALPMLAKVCDAAQGEMKLLFFLGIYTALRLKDCCLLRWEDVDMAHRTITVVPAKMRRRKTGRDASVTIPIGPQLYPMLAATPPDHMTGYVLPETAETYRRRRNTITSRVQRILEACGLELYYEAEEGEAGARKQIKYGFHSLRHSAVTMLREAGAPEAVTMALVGHDSPAMTGQYTHVGTAALAAAVNSMPTLLTNGNGAGKAEAEERADRERLAKLSRTGRIALVRQALALFDD